MDCQPSSCLHHSQEASTLRVPLPGAYWRTFEACKTYLRTSGRAQDLSRNFAEAKAQRILQRCMHQICAVCCFVMLRARPIGEKTIEAWPAFPEAQLACGPGREPQSVKQCAHSTWRFLHKQNERFLASNGCVLPFSSLQFTISLKVAHAL